MSLMKPTAIAIAVLALAGVTVGGCASVDKVRARFVAAPPRCETMNFPVYFRDNSDALTGPAMQTISATAARAKGCKIAAVEVIGLGDAKGTASQNLELSKRRAQAVADALKANGFPVPTYVAGEGGAANGPPNPSQQGAQVRIRFGA
jgi:peptidoglycan-associated lipoprotein